MKNHLTPLWVCALVACAAPDTARQGDKGTQVVETATTPLSDLNLVRTEIPAALLAAQKGPYALPPEASCEALVHEVQELDAALGPDLDTPATPANPGLIERGAGALGSAAVDALRGAAEGVVPFRGWVRKLTGAERYSKEGAAAIAAGTVRRAYLKGVGQSRGCPAPAAPRSPS
jgi:hypothetical protein